ncbi:hypothetical protein D5S17_11465 [Pseudonocardiaceae bacterium YIM PH 21723]|nr:hypothetical protein D5S17_11465 [Pseudonocardiaceae bacterium YIM PH 21723]
MSKNDELSRQAEMQMAALRKDLDAVSEKVQRLSKDVKYGGRGNRRREQGRKVVTAGAALLGMLGAGALALRSRRTGDHS